MEKSLLFDSPTRNVFLNILNVLKRISDKDFIENYWGNYPIDQGVMIISCQEAIEILHDYSLFDLLLYNRGIWSDISDYLPNSFIDKLTQLLIKIDAFKGYEKRANFLLLDENWLEIMLLSKYLSNELEKTLNVENDFSYLN